MALTEVRYMPKRFTLVPLHVTLSRCMRCGGVLRGLLEASRDRNRQQSICWCAEGLRTSDSTFNQYPSTGRSVMHETESIEYTTMLVVCSKQSSFMIDLPLSVLLYSRFQTVIVLLLLLLLLLHRSLRTGCSRLSSGLVRPFPGTGSLGRRSRA